MQLEPLAEWFVDYALTEMRSAWIQPNFLLADSVVNGTRTQENPLSAHRHRRAARLYPETANRRCRNRGARA